MIRIDKQGKEKYIEIFSSSQNECIIPYLVKAQIERWDWVYVYYFHLGATYWLSSSNDSYLSDDSEYLGLFRVTSDGEIYTLESGANIRDIPHFLLDVIKEVSNYLKLKNAS